MKRWLSVLLVALLLGTLISPVSAQTPVAPPVPPFWDVIGTEYQYPVGYLHTLGLVSGTGENTFGPRDPVTRAQMAAFVVRALGKQGAPVSAPVNFTDVDARHWAAGVIAQAASLGVVRGTTTTTFDPNAPVTYEQAATMLLRALNYEKALKGDYPVVQVLKAKELGWLEGTKFEIGKTATRGDIAIMLAAAVFTTPDLDSGLTLSQSVHKQAVSTTVGPDASYVTAGTTKLEALGYDWFGKSFSLTGATWSGSGSGFTVTADGTLTVNTADSVNVAFQKGSLSGSRKYDVIKSIRISGAEGGVKAGGSITLKAEGTTAAGRTVSVKPVWTVKSGPGVITPAGVLNSTGSGSIVVEARAGDLKAEVSVAAAAGITVSPTTVTLATGQTQRFTANVVDASGNAVSLPVTWSIVQGSGTITPDGLLTAGNSGPIKVQAAVGDLKTVATVGLISRIEINPVNPSVAKGGTVQFSAKGYALDGTEIPLSPTWTTSGGVGIMGTNGVLVGTTVGTGTVHAEYFGLRASTGLTVAGPPVAIKVEAAQLSLPANGKTSTTLTATIVDARGVPADGTVETISFSTSSSNLGTLSTYSAKVENGKATVTFTPTELAGQIIIVASAPGTQLISGSTTINTVVPSVARIKLEAYPTTLAADGYSQTQITATLEDTYGVAIKNQGGAIGVNLSLGSGATGVLGSGQIIIGPAETSGSTYLRATSTVGVTRISGSGIYAVAPVEVRTVVVTPAAKLQIRPNSKDAKADSVEAMVIQVEVQDAQGNVRTGDTGLNVQLTGTNGTDSLGTYTATVTNGIATFRVITDKAGTYTLRATAVNSTITAAEGTGTFVPGAPVAIQVTADPSSNVAADGVSVVRLKARIVDQKGNTVTSAGHPVTFTKVSNAGSTSVVNSATLTPTNGVAVLELKSTAIPGRDSFVASAQGLQSSARIDIDTRVTGGAYRVVVQPLSVTQVQAGQSFTVKVHVLDAVGQGQLVTGSNGRSVSLITNSATAVVSGPGTTENGVATFTVHDTKAGGADKPLVLTASSPGLLSDTTGQRMTVVPGNLSTVRLVASPEGLAADGTSSTAVTAQALDKYGNSVIWSTAIQLQIDNTTSGRLTSNYLYSGGQVSLYSTTTPGTINVTGTGVSTAINVAPLTIRTYVPAAPAKVVVEEVASAPASDFWVSPITFRVKILDVNGNLATGVHTGNLMSAVGLTITGSTGQGTTRITSGSNSGLPSFVPNGLNLGSTHVTNGVATFQFTNRKAESVLITPVAYYNGQLLQAVGARVTTTPGAARKVVVQPNNAVVTSEAAVPVNITAWVSDDWDNAISVPDDTFVFTPDTTAYLSFPDNLTVTPAEGKAQLTVTSKSGSAGRTKITIRSTKTGLTNELSGQNFYVATDLPPAKPTSIQVTNQDGTSTFVSRTSGPVRVRVTVPTRQSVQNVLVYVNGSLKAAYADTGLTAAASGVSSGETTWTGYIANSDFILGNNSVTVIIVTGLGLGPVSDSVTITVQ